MSKVNSRNLDEDVVVVCDAHREGRVGCHLLLVDVLLSCLMAMAQMEKSTNCLEARKDLNVGNDVPNNEEVGEDG